MKKELLKILLAILLALLGNSQVSAQSPQLVVWLKGGEKVYYNLEDLPITKFSGSDVLITTHTVEVAYPLEQVIRYTYENLSTEIESVLAGNDLYVSRQGDVITFQNLHPTTPVQLFSIDGQLLETRNLNAETAVSISLNAYPVGIYVVKVNGVTYKMMKR